MRLSRRMLLGALPALPGRLASADYSLAAAPRERVELRHSAEPGRIAVPAARARLLAQPMLGGAAVALLGFAADPDAATWCDLVAVIGPDGAGLRVLALEVLTWRAADGAHLATRLAATPDGTRLVLTREAAAPRTGRLVWYREQWTDMLTWRADAPLADAPVRAPRPGTWQAALAATRAGTHDSLVVPRLGVDEALWRAAGAVPRPPFGSVGR